MARAAALVLFAAGALVVNVLFSFIAGRPANQPTAGILDGFQTIIPTAAAVLSEKRQILRLTQQEVADRAKITLRQYQRLESGERSILTCSFGLACRVIEALDMDVSKFYHGDYYLEEELKTTRGKGFSSRKKLSI